MELNEAFRRIVGQHWRLLSACLLTGMTLGLLFAPHGNEYSASARLVLDTPDPVARQQSEAIADTAKAIATSPSQVSRALRKAGVDRGDPAAFAKQHVSLVALGSSGVLQLSVTDRDRQVSASVANALASLVINTRLGVTNGQADRVFADLDQRTVTLNRKIATADEDLNLLNVQIAEAATAREANALRAKHDAAQQSRDFLAQQRGVLESARVSLLSTSALRPRPSVISAATPPAKAEPSPWLTYLILGALLGLILGIGAAGLIETIRPTLVGSETVAGELDAALLGTLRSGAATEATTKDIGARLRLAAEAAGVGNVGLFAAGPAIDLGHLAESLSAVSAEAEREPFGTDRNPANGNGHAPGLRIQRFSPEGALQNNGSGTGLVLVAPTALKKTELTGVGHLLKASNLPLLGLITYAPPGVSHLVGVESTVARIRRVVSQ